MIYRCELKGKSCSLINWSSTNCLELSCWSVIILSTQIVYFLEKSRRDARWIPPLVINFQLAAESSNCFALLNFSSASFYQATLKEIQVVKEDSNFGTKASSLFVTLLIAFARGAWAGEIHSTVMTKMQIVHRTFNRRHSIEVLTWGMTMTAKIKDITTTYKDNLSLIFSSLVPSLGFMLSLVIH